MMILFYTIIIITLILVFVGYVFISTRIVLKLEDRIRKMEELYVQNESYIQDIKSKVSSELISGIEKIKEGDEKYLRFIELSRKNQNQGLPIMKNNDAPAKLDTGGELIPANLTREELEVLGMFYDKNEQ